MFAILIHHIIYHGQLVTKYKNYNEITFVNICTLWNINSFGLISGIIGHKTNKYSNLLYLWVCVVFYSVGIHLFLKSYKPHLLGDTKLIFEFFPVVFYRYWHFTQYFGMYLFLPVLIRE